MMNCKCFYVFAIPFPIYADFCKIARSWKLYLEFRWKINYFSFRSVLGFTKDDKVENDDFQDDSQLNSISFVESKNQVHKCILASFNITWLPVLSALNFIQQVLERMWQPYLSYNRSWPISGGRNYNSIFNVLIFFLLTMNLFWTFCGTQ